MHTPAQQLHWMDWRNDIPLITDLLPEPLKGFDFERAVSSFTSAPARNTAAVVGLATVLFYLAERGKNPKVKDIFDAMVYCSTCLSVGYGDIFAQTPVGKLIGTVLMTYGPSLANATMDGGGGQRPSAYDEEILDTLQQILAELRQMPTGDETP